MKTYPVPKKNKQRERPGVAVGAVVFEDGKILLVKRDKAPQKGKWAIPGGSVNLGETLQAAAEREVKEETGLLVQAKEPFHTFDLIEKDAGGKILFHYVIVDLHADYKSGRIQPADDVSDAAWFGPEEVETIDTSASTIELLRKIGFVQ